MVAFFFRMRLDKLEELSFQFLSLASKTVVNK